MFNILATNVERLKSVFFRRVVFAFSAKLTLNSGSLVGTTACCLFLEPLNGLYSAPERGQMWLLSQHEMR